MVCRRDICSCRLAEVERMEIQFSDAETELSTLSFHNFPGA